MNLYNLHEDPQSLLYFRETPEIVPDLFWDKYRYDKEELKKREREISKYAEYSYYYARYVLKGSFPAGEEAISKDAEYAKDYAEYILRADFYLDGKLIAKAE